MTVSGWSPRRASGSGSSVRSPGGWALGLALALALTACGGDDGGDDTSDVAGAVGTAGSECPLPVVFDRLTGWVPEKIVDLDDKGEAALDALMTPGPFHVVCELESPSNLGYLRVYVGPERLAAKDQERLLRTVVKELDDGVELAFSTSESDDGLVLTEVSYVEVREVLDERAKRRAFLVAGEDGVVVVHLGGLDDEEHEGMLPAYELAKDSVRATPTR